MYLADGDIHEVSYCGKQYAGSSEGTVEIFYMYISAVNRIRKLL